MSPAARRLFRVLACLCALAALWTVVLWLTGGFRLQFGVLRLSSRVTRLPLTLTLALAWGLLAWAVSMTGERRPDVRGAAWGRRLRFAFLVGAMTVGFNVLLLIAPPPPPALNACAFIRELAWGRHLLNCDSPGFLALAQTPGLILTPAHQTRQSRPLSLALAHAVAAPLRLVRWIANSDLYRPFAAEFVAYALINVALVVLGMLCLTRLMESGGAAAPPGIELLLTLVALGTNDLTKLFMWSPHTQILNLFVPCLSLYVTWRLVERGQPIGIRQAVLLGLGLGTGFLAYGSFLIPVLSVVVIEVVVFRRVIGAACVAASSVVPYACWVLYVRHVTGGFYSHEVDAYRQFIWIGDCLKLGVTACVPIATGNAWMFIHTASPIVVPPLLAIFCCRVARYALPRPIDAAGPGRSIGLAITVTFLVTAAFLGLMGFYVPRLCWMLIPPLLLTLAFELQAFRLSLRKPDGWLFKGVVLAVSAVYILILVSRQGPYT